MFKNLLLLPLVVSSLAFATEKTKSSRQPAQNRVSIFGRMSPVRVIDYSGGSSVQISSMSAGASTAISKTVILCEMNSVGFEPAGMGSIQNTLAFASKKIGP